MPETLTIPDIHCSYDDLVDLVALVPHPRNPNTHPTKQIELLAKIIASQGWRAPITVSKRSGFIIRGHGRLMAAQKLGLDQAPVDYQDYATEAEEWADLVADNRIAELAKIDEDELAKLMAELSDGDLDMELTGFGEKELDRILAAATPVDIHDDGFDAEAEAEKITEPVTQPGDIWLLGEHRLMCGDSTSAANVQVLMDGQRAALFSTDPPYLVDYNGTNHPQKWNESEKNRAKKNKDWNESYQDWDNSQQGEGLYEGFISVAIAHAIIENAAWYCWHASRNQAMLEAVWKKYGAFMHQQIIWAKDRAVLTRCWYLWQHEPCLFGWVKGKKPDRLASDHPSTVWNFPTIAPGTATEHPTSKPVELFAIPILQHTSPGDICYEPFSGSGTQFIAAEQADRICYGMERSPIFCDVVVKRWEQLTGRSAHAVHSEK
ncbi:MAG: site-specific DNA-methyltransferase [Actinobacteria bacterium]|nr:site-specific DNA-methyltransferase [Actinomycetota bacterium]